MTHHRVGDIEVEILEGDITEQDTDAIVNAANNQLLLGAGVAGAIARAGGPGIQAECDRAGPVELGGAALTGGGRLKARYVLHAASMRLGGRTTREHLRSSMDRCFQLAAQQGIRSLAVPAVGTGVGSLSMANCAAAMVESLRKARDLPNHPQEVRFVLFGDVAKRGFETAFAAALEGLD